MFERMALDDAFTFANHDPLIRVHAGYCLGLALRPPDRQVGFDRTAQTGKCTLKSPCEIWNPPLRTSSTCFRPPAVSVRRAPATSRPEAVTARTSRAFPLGAKFLSKDGGSKRLTTSISSEPSLSSLPRRFHATNVLQ